MQTLALPANASPVIESRPTATQGTAELLDSAHGIVRQMARETAAQAHKPDQDAGRERPVLAPLDRSLNRKAAAGETRLANGILRIRTASGREYCLQPPPGYAAGGPVEALSIPTNCP